MVAVRLICAIVRVLIDEVTNIRSAIWGRSRTFDLPGTSFFPVDCPMGSTHSLTSAMSTLEWRVGCVARGVYAIGCVLTRSVHLQIQSWR
jgi:hypothetical protein